jgi:hypothetical protein
MECARRAQFLRRLPGVFLVRIPRGRIVWQPKIPPRAHVGNLMSTKPELPSVEGDPLDVRKIVYHHITHSDGKMRGGRRVNVRIVIVRFQEHVLEYISSPKSVPRHDRLCAERDDGELVWTQRLERRPGNLVVGDIGSGDLSLCGHQPYPHGRRIEF